MTPEVRQIARVPLSLLTRLRLVLLGHEDLAGILFWAALVGFGGALSSVAFREGLRLLEVLFTGQYTSLERTAASMVWWHRMLLPCGGAVLAGSVLRLAGRVLAAPRAVDYMEAVRVGDGSISVRATLANSCSSLLTIASGGSIGREGSMVQLAAMLGSRVGLLAHAPIPRLRLMVACGGAAGIAAAYNAPISGALFVSEIILGGTAMESFGPLVVASVVASATVHRFLGYAPVYDVPKVQFASNWELIFYVVLGVLLGHLAPPFLASLDFAKARFVALKLPVELQLGLGGLIVGVISIAAPEVWGNGFGAVGSILNGHLLGWWLHSLLPGVTSVPAAYALVGMGGFLAATTHAPLTSILMLFEMTLDYDMVLPLMLACVTAHYTAKVYRRGESIYHAALKGRTAGQDWQLNTVAALIKPAAAVVPRTQTLKEMFEALPRRPLERAYVTDGAELVGWLDLRGLLARLRAREIDAAAPVVSVMQPVTLALTDDLSLGAALDVFLRASASTLPVTGGQWRNNLLGEVSRQDVLLAMQDRMVPERDPSTAT